MLMVVFMLMSMLMVMMSMCFCFVFHNDVLLWFFLQVQKYKMSGATWLHSAL